MLSGLADLGIPGVSGQPCEDDVDRRGMFERAYCSVKAWQTVVSVTVSRFAGGDALLVPHPAAIAHRPTSDPSSFRILIVSRNGWALLGKRGTYEIPQVPKSAGFGHSYRLESLTLLLGVNQFIQPNSIQWCSSDGCT